MNAVLDNIPRVLSVGQSLYDFTQSSAGTAVISAVSSYDGPWNWAGQLADRAPPSHSRVLAADAPRVSTHGELRARFPDEFDPSGRWLADGRSRVKAEFKEPSSINALSDGVVGAVRVGSAVRSHSVRNTFGVRMAPTYAPARRSRRGSRSSGSSSGRYKRSWSKRRSGKLSKASPLLRGLRFAASGQPQIKCVDSPLAVSTQTLTSIGSGAVFNSTSAGSSNWQRAGRKICMKSLHVKAFLDQINYASLPDPYLRLVVVYDSQANGSTPTFAQVFQSYDNAGGTVSSILAPVNLDNRERFRVIVDKAYHLGATGATTGPPVGSVIATGRDSVVDIMINLSNLETVYNADTTGIGSIATGSLLMYLQEITTAGLTAGDFVLRGNGRLLFCDA